MISLLQARSYLPENLVISDEDLSSVLADAYLVANFAVTDFLENKLTLNKNDNGKQSLPQ